MLAALLLATPLALPDDARAQDRRIEIDLAEVLDQARVAFREGRLEEAIALYQVVVRFDPDNRAARVELSFALAAFGDRERATRLLRDLDTEGLDPDVIAAIGQIVGPDRLSFFLVPEVFLDTNINGQTKDATVQTVFGPLVLENDGKGREGFGYGITTGAVYRLPSEVPTTLTAGIRVLDFQQTRDDEARLFASVSAELGLGSVDLLPTVSGAYRFRDGDPYEADIGLGLAAAMDLRPVRNTVGGRVRRVFGQGDFDGDRDREAYELYDIVSIGFADAALRMEARYFREDWARLDSQDNGGFVLGLDTILTDIDIVRPTIGGSFTYRDFDNPSAFFGKARLDREYEGHLELLLRDVEIFGSNPFIRYAYTDVSSNIGLFDHDRHEVSIGVRALTW